MADAVQFTGGSDVDPSVYGEHRHPRTFSQLERDVAEAKVYQQAIAAGVPCLGVCRGAQFLNVMNGGSLFQHVENHAIRGNHPVWSETFEEYFNVSSTHHQMMIAGEAGYVEGWAWGMSPRKEFMVDEDTIGVNTKSKREAEVVWYEASQSLCFQAHPEYFGEESTESYYFRLINHYLGL